MGQALAHGDEDFGDETFKAEQIPIVIVYMAVVIGAALLVAKLVLQSPHENEETPNILKVDPDREDPLED